MKSFLTWVESEESPALAEPQHKKGEANMALEKIVEKRIRSMIMDLESSGKGTQEEILDSMNKVAEKMGAKKSEPQQMQQPQQTQLPDMQPQAPAGQIMI